MPTADIQALLARFEYADDAYLKEEMDSAVGQREAITPLLIALLEELAASGPCQPERLLTLPLAEEERAYVVRLLTRPPSYESTAEDDPVRQLGEELATWLRSTLQKHTGAGLQQQILEASRLGQTDRVMELLRLKLESERKRTGF